MSLSTSLFSRIVMLSAALLLLAGCNSSDTEPAATQRADSPAASSTEADAVAFSSLVAESLHELPLPDPGFARVQALGMSREFALTRDCTVDTDPPSPTENWGLHVFDTTITGNLEDGGRMVLSVVRRIYLDDSIWRASGHENETVVLQIFRGQGQGQTIETYHYRMKRMRPGAAPRAAWSSWDAVSDADIDPPLIRVHPDGRRATFVGLVGQVPADRPTGEHTPHYEMINIAIHCG